VEPRARKAVFLGFKRGVKGYKLWDYEDRKIVLSRDVSFDEPSMVKSSSSQQLESAKPRGYHKGWRVMYVHHLQIVRYHLGCRLL